MSAGSFAGGGPATTTTGMGADPATGAGPATGTGPAAETGLHAQIIVERLDFSLDLTLPVAPGSVTAIVGPNGAGKSTAIEAIAGLIEPTSGRVSLDGRVLEDAASGRRLSSADRGIGVVFQNYLLFPHLNARDNVAFGLRARGTPKAQAAALAERWLDRLGIGDRARALPRELSGGQAQRVALARALVLEPRLLLLDEPLAAIDAETRVEVRAQLAEQLRAFGGATVLVTHDPVDAMLLADEVVVLERGRVTQQGCPLSVAAAPATDYVARLMGLNLLRRGSSTVMFSPGECHLSALKPSDTTLPTAAPIACRVRGLEQLGGRLRVHLETVRFDTGHLHTVESLEYGTDLAPTRYSVAAGQLLVAEVTASQLRLLGLATVLLEPASSATESRSVHQPLVWLSIPSRP